MVKITYAKIDFKACYQQVVCEEAGAICCFFGNVRQGDYSEPLEYIFYESYEKAAKKELQKIVQEMKKEFSIQKIFIIHRLGKLLPKETSLLVLVASSHRKESFQACEKIIKEIKKTVPIWKKEVLKNEITYWSNEAINNR